MILTKPTLAAAGLTSLALAFNNPAGHYALNEIGMRVALTAAHQHARHVTGLHTLSFDEFKNNAGFYLMLYYNNDVEKVTEVIGRLDNAVRILCLPIEDTDSPTQDNAAFACHAVTNRNDKKMKPPKNKVA